VDLPGDYGISATFNVADLRPYVDESEEIRSLRSNSHNPGRMMGTIPFNLFWTKSLP